MAEPVSPKIAAQHLSVCGVCKVATNSTEFCTVGNYLSRINSGWMRNNPGGGSGTGPKTNSD